MAVDFTKALKKASTTWKDARTKAAESSGGTEFDDGKYLARLVKGEIGKSEAGRLQVTWHWKFLEGEYETQIKYAYQGLETLENQSYLIKDLERLGYDCSELDLTELQEVLDDVRKNKPTCRITLKTKGEFQNVYINRLMNPAEDDDDDSDTKDDADEKPAKKKAKADNDDDDDNTKVDDDDADEKPAKKKKKTKDDDDEEVEEEEAEEKEEEEEEDEDEVHVRPGTKVVVNLKDGKMKGTVLEVFPDDQKVRVKCDNGKTVKVSAEKIDVQETVPDKPEKDGKKKVVKKK
jgi:hypothetical protein